MKYIFILYSIIFTSSLFSAQQAQSDTKKLSKFIIIQNKNIFHPIEIEQQYFNKRTGQCILSSVSDFAEAGKRKKICRFFPLNNESISVGLLSKSIPQAVYLSITEGGCVKYYDHIAVEQDNTIITIKNDTTNTILTQCYRTDVPFIIGNPCLQCDKIITFINNTVKNISITQAYYKEGKQKPFTSSLHVLGRKAQQTLLPLWSNVKTITQLVVAQARQKYVNLNIDETTIFNGDILTIKIAKKLPGEPIIIRNQHGQILAQLPNADWCNIVKIGDTQPVIRYYPLNPLSIKNECT